MAKRKTKLTTKRKKKWFTVEAPKIYKNVEVAEITAFEPKNLIGRAVEVSFAKVTNNPRDQHKKIIFKIKDTRGEKALTEPWKFFLQEGYMQRASRRFKERIISVVKTKAKDGKPVKIKLLTLIINKLPRTLRTELSKKIEQFVTEKISKVASDELFAPMVLDKMSLDLKKELKQVYPVRRLLVWKLTLV